MMSGRRSASLSRLAGSQDSISSLPTRGARLSATLRLLEDAADLCPISAEEVRRRYEHEQRQIGLSAGLSSHFASSHFSTWHRTACLQPLSIEYLGRSAYRGGLHLPQWAKCVARRQGTP